MKAKKLLLGAAISSIAMGTSYAASANGITEALTSGKGYGDLNLRFESAEQDNAREDASALTLRTRIGYVTGEVSGFSAHVSFEDVRIVGSVDDFSVPVVGFNGNQFSVIADPEVTELDQGFLQYKSGIFTAKLGRQVIAYDNHRFIGHVGWRQDRQTFEAFTVNLKPSKDLEFNYNFIDSRERIFAEVGDQDSNDHLLRASYNTSAGKLVGYAYLLKLDNALETTHDTFGVRFAGKSGKFSYEAELATQSFETNAGADNDAIYALGKLGYNFGPVTLTGAYELLGSDDGNYGFATPLATLHKFNGWADLFLGTPAAGLQDLSVKLSGKAGGGSWAVVYHDFSADESGASDDLGDEIDFVYKRKFGKNYNFGVKAAFYSSGDGAQPDTDRFWVWVGAKF